MTDKNRISVVIIGLNVEDSIGQCIASVLDADYPSKLLEIIYVDGGSMDRSVEIAGGFERVRVIELRDTHPTPGRGRNAGLHAARYDIVQFLDADTTVYPGWFKKALPCLEGTVAAVTGRVVERDPERNIFHVIGNMEWSISAGRKGLEFKEGPCPVFGGIVLVRKDAIIQAGTYDESLVAGEDPDLSYRVRKNGWSIYRVSSNMVDHDLNMNTLGQYLKRSLRSGHAYAEIGMRYMREKERFFLRQLVRICLGATLPAVCLVLFMLLGRIRLGAALAVMIAFRPFSKIFAFSSSSGSLKRAALYCAHLSFVVYPQFTGVLMYLMTCATGVPLTNKGFVYPEKGQRAP
ncbi:MAG TPA: glycosyltransferase [Deltaproteobacteria bacterium]|nr:glycosyltransferase [Deltaproteobacteria bacterium]